MAALDRAPEARKNTEVEAVLLALRDAVPVIQSRALELDRRATFPAEDIALLARLGALAAMAGDRPSPHQLMEALRLVGRANLSLGRLFEGHINGARLVAWYGSQRLALEADLAAGRVFGVWNTEPAPGVTIQAETLQGLKSYATGAGHIDRAVVTGRLPSGDKQMVLADANDPARADPTAWQVRGMKATVSGTYDLSGLPVNDDTRLGRPGDYEREPRFSAGAWRFTAVQLGGIEHVLTLLRDHLANSPAGQDPVHRARFGKALAATRSAYLWVLRAAERGEAPDADTDDIALVLMTRGVVEDAGLNVMDAVARSVGTRAFFSDNPLDAACRDLALYLRQPVPDQALDRAAATFLARDAWRGDRLW